MVLLRFLIKKGRHYPSKLRQFKLLHYPKSEEVFSFEEVCNFDKTCLYIFGDEDDGDANKLFGVSLGVWPRIKNWKFYPPHHINSLRFGWKCDWEQQKITIWEYYYQDYKRYSSKYICTIDTNKYYKFYLKFNRDGGILFTVYDRNKDKDWVILMATSNIRKTGLKINRFGWKFFPYFGGNRRAPHSMFITWIH